MIGGALGIGAGSASSSSASTGGGALAGAGSLLGDVWMPFVNWAANRKARSNWRKSLQRGPSYWKQGMERAGINPLYALSKGGGPGNLFMSGPAPSSGQGMGERAVHSAQAGAMMRQSMKWTIDRMRAEARHAENIAIMSDRDRQRADRYWELDRGLLAGEEGPWMRRAAMYGPPAAAVVNAASRLITPRTSFHIPGRRGSR